MPENNTNMPTPGNTPDPNRDPNYNPGIVDPERPTDPQVNPSGDTWPGEENPDRGANIPDPNRGSEIPDTDRGAEIPDPDRGADIPDVGQDTDANPRD